MVVMPARIPAGCAELGWVASEVPRRTGAQPTPAAGTGQRCPSPSTGSKPTRVEHRRDAQATDRDAASERHVVQPERRAPVVRRRSGGRAPSGSTGQHQGHRQRLAPIPLSTSKGVVGRQQQERERGRRDPRARHQQRQRRDAAGQPARGYAKPRAAPARPPVKYRPISAPAADSARCGEVPDHHAPVSNEQEHARQRCRPRPSAMPVGSRPTGRPSAAVTESGTGSGAFGGQQQHARGGGRAHSDTRQRPYPLASSTSSANERRDRQ